MDSNYLANVMTLCLSGDQNKRREGIQYLSEAKKNPDFSVSMLRLSADEGAPKEVRQTAVIQLKNFVKEEWNAPGEDGLINSQNKQIIKENILSLLPTCNGKPIFKTYILIVSHILKRENEWKEFIQTVGAFLSSVNQFEIYCGVAAFYQLAKRYEYEMEFTKRDIYNSGFALVLPQFEHLMDSLLTAINADTSLFSEDESQFLSMKILYKITKIFFRTINLGAQIPKIVTEEQRVDKWVNYFLFIIRLEFPSKFSHLSVNPSTVKDLESLQNSALWKIKYYCYDIFFKLFEKYGDLSKMSKKDVNGTALANLIDNVYSKVIYEAFLGTLFLTKDKYVDEEIICLIYQFFQLIINRNHHSLLPLLEGNLEVIMKEFMIQGNMLGVWDFDMMNNNLKQYIYKQFEKGHSVRYKRDSICEFLVKLSEFKRPIPGSKRNRKNINPAFLEVIYNFLISSLQNVESEIKTVNNEQSLNYLLLFKESCIKLLESIHISLATYYENNIEEIISTFIVGNLDPNSVAGRVPWMKERAFSFIYSYSHAVTFKNEELMKYIVNAIINNIISRDDLMISIKCALIIPKILESNPNIKEFFRNDIANMFSIYLKLMQELDLDQLIKCLEKLVGSYPNEVIGFSIELTKELINAFNKFMENNNEDILNAEGGFEEQDEEDSTAENSNLTTASGIIRTIEKLLKVSAKNKNGELFYEIEKLIAPIINWGLHSQDISSTFNDVVDLLYTLVSSSPVISDICWSFYPLVFGSIITLDKNTIREGVAFENIQEIIPIILQYMIKDPEKLIQMTDQNGVNLLSKTLFIVPQIISLSKNKNDEISCNCAQKIMITMLETYKGSLDHIMKDIISFIVSEMKSAEQLGYKGFKMMLLQTLSLCYVYNPKITNSILEEMQITHLLFEMWIPQINNMRYDFEYRRTVMAFSSLLLLDQSELNKVLKDNLAFILLKIVELFNKLTQMREASKNENEEADVSGDEAEEDDEDKDIDFQSKDKNIKSQLQDFIENDLDESDNEDDEDYNGGDDAEKGSSSFKTRLDAQDEFIYLQDILVYLNQTNQNYYNYLMSLLNENSRNDLVIAIEKAKKRISEKVQITDNGIINNPNGIH